MISVGFNNFSEEHFRHVLYLYIYLLDTHAAIYDKFFRITTFVSNIN